MFRRMTVDVVVQKTIERLQQVEEQQWALARVKHDKANKLFADAEVAEAEADRAALTATRLRQLLEWPSRRKSDAELGDALKAARGDKLFQELEHRYMTVCADLDRLRSENEVLRERIATVLGWRENDWPEGFCRRTAEMVADLARTEPKESSDEQTTAA